MKRRYSGCHSQVLTTRFLLGMSQLQIHRTGSFSMHGRSLVLYLKGMQSAISSLMFGLKDAEQIFVQVSTGSSNDTSY